jgi:molecular chaperone GrpE
VLLFGGLVGLPYRRETILVLALIPPAIGLLYATRRSLAFTEIGSQWSRWFRQALVKVSPLFSAWHSFGSAQSGVEELNQFGTLPEDSGGIDETSESPGSLSHEDELRQTREWATYLESELKDREERMQELEARLAQVRDELQDARKTEETRQPSNEGRLDILSDLFDIRDNFRRALDAETHLEEDAAEEYRDSLELIDRQIKSTLQREGIEEIETTGQADPSKHHVVETVSTTESEQGEIVDVQRLGYRQGDRVLREAQVVVAADPHTEIDDTGTRSGNCGDQQ